MYTIGVDIGGTNTDMVLVDRDLKIVASVKRPTTQQIDLGFGEALDALKVDSKKVERVLVGTTHATNALLQKEDLYRVGLIRIAGHNPMTLPPCFGWPKDLQETVFVGCVTVGGGYECNGSEITPFCRKQLRSAIDDLLKKGAESFAIVGVFSPLYPEHELAVLEEVNGKFPISLSHQIGGVGIIERENSTLLNAALKKPLAKGFSLLKRSLEKRGILAPLFLTQNNGTILSLEKALQYPILTISAGPTNSFIGGAKLAGLESAIIVDIGGTSTDVGIVKMGFARRSLNKSNIGGVLLNFSMPDVLSIALGGGSYIALETGEIGPKSCGKNITQEAICFGGSRWTLTDIALAKNPLIISGAFPIHCQEADKILQSGVKKIEDLVSLIEGKEKNLPVVVVGGGAELFRGLLPSRYFIPHNASVANAYGAALSEVIATVDVVTSLTDREAVLAELIEKSRNLAMEQGADPKTVRLVDLQTIPYHYIPGNLARVIASSAGSFSGPS